MSEFGFPWFEVISPVASLLVPGAGALIGVWYRLNNQVIATNERLAAFELRVAKEYATNSAIKEVEDRIVGAIDRLGDRLDKFIDNRNRT